MIASIIILTYNSSSYIDTLLSKIQEKFSSEIKKGELEILVADNASKDDTVKKAKKYSSAVRVLENGGNYGFAKGNNLAVKKAKGKYVLFINPDTEFVKGDVLKLLGHLENNNVGVVGGEIFSFHDSREYSCGKFYTFVNILILALGLEEKLGIRFAPEKKTYVDYVSGAFLGIKKSVFEELNGFDEHYFMYIEDQDLCFRVKKKGLSVLFSPDATIRHVGQGSSNRSFAVVNIYKGLSYFQKKHMSVLSYRLSIATLRLKALTLITLGKLTHNSYLTSTYEKALQVI